MKMKRYCLAFLLLLNGAPAMAVNVEEMTVLKVCADPVHVAFFQSQGTGF